MNKEFRVWRYCHEAKKYKFYYLTLMKVCINDGADIVFQERDCGYFDDGVMDPKSENIVIQQFTGLKDLSGNKIFEGDAIAYCRKPIRMSSFAIQTGNVIWDNDRAMFTVNGIPLSDKTIDKIQVNGTIFD